MKPLLTTLIGIALSGSLLAQEAVVSKVNKI